MTGGDLVLIARRRAGLSQRELAERLACRQATIARWERGDRQPSFADVQAAAAACSLQLDAHLAREDRSWWPQIAMQLDLDPLERVRRLSTAASADLVDHLELLAGLGAPAIVIGAAAGALHGSPLVLNHPGLELCVRPDAARGVLDAMSAAAQPDCADAVVVVSKPAGTAGFGDLARGAELLELGAGEVRVAGLLDLLRIADASPDPGARRHALAYQALLDVRRARRRASPIDDHSDAEKIKAWLSHQTPAA